MGYPRYLKDRLVASLGASPVVLLTGGRQTGKTTLMKEIGKELGFDYVTLDDLRLLGGARKDPVGFLNQHETPLIIDEVQRAPDLALPIKLKVDEARKEGLYALTGSSNPLVAPALSDSLAGRMFILHMWPLAQAELRGSIPHFLDQLFASTFKPKSVGRWDRAELAEVLVKGGYPTAHTLDDEMRDEWFNNHLRTLLERDIQEITQIRKLDDLPSLMQLIGTRSGSLVNLAEFGRTTGIPSSTLATYLTLLEALFLTTRLPAWHKNVTKRMVKSPKLYATDPGIAAFLMGANREHLLARGQLMGRLLETFVVTEVLKHMSWVPTHLSAYHYRTTTGIDVDLLLQNRAGDVVGIEIKSSETPHANDFTGLKHLQEELGSQFIRGVVLYPGEEVVPFGKDLFALPLSSLK